MLLDCKAKNKINIHEYIFIQINDFKNKGKGTYLSYR